MPPRLKGIFRARGSAEARPGERLGPDEKSSASGTQTGTGSTMATRLRLRQTG